MPSNLDPSNLDPLDLEALRIRDRDLERLSGLEVSDLFIGGLLGGVYRLPVLKTRQRSLSFFFTEFVVSALVYVLSLPLGLAVIRDAANQNNPMTVLQFVATTVGMTVLILCIWHLYLWKTAQKLRPLMHLLDQIDRFHEVLDSIAVMDDLRLAQLNPVEAVNRDRILTALQSTRDSLVAGLMAEKILRRSKGQSRDRSGMLISHIDENLASLSTLEIHHQAREYSAILNETLDIGLQVQAEMQQLAVISQVGHHSPPMPK